MSPSRGALVLFTRDLRVRDQAPLASAARECDRVVPAFVLDRHILRATSACANRLAFLLESLRSLERGLAERGAHLLVRDGALVEQALKLAREWDLSTIHMSADVTPYARERERALRAACKRERIELRVHPGINLVPAGEIAPAGGDHYRVFTAYWRVWRELAGASPARAPARIPAPAGLTAPRLPELAALSSGSCSPARQRGGEEAGREQLARWLRDEGAGYDEARDQLGTQSTSRLSAHLHFGCLSPLTVLERTSARVGGEAFARQLCWRDFHHQVLAARPEIPHADYRPGRRRWQRDERSARAWREGLTGYPIVDAGMRQLAAEGFMHNRARLIVGSFLTKTLQLDWRIGAAHFARLLSDADVASNVGNWQWVAGTGNDTRPNRVLNPLRQARRFDPHGDYVRRHLPELAGVPGPLVHEPWRLGRERAALDYPERLVDHELAAAAYRAGRPAHPMTAERTR